MVAAGDMRLGLVSDVHGNADALAAALADGVAAGVDRWVALGDLVCGGPDPVRVLELLDGVDAVTIAGNTDRVIATDPFLTFEPDRVESIDGVAAFVEMAAAHAWTRGVLHGAGWLRRVATLPATARLEVEDRVVLAMHAWVDRDVGPGIDPDRPDAELSADLGAVRDRAGLKAGAVLAGGHTHRFTDRLVDRIRLVNPGTIGYPDASGEATYAVVEVAAGVRVERRSVRFAGADLVRRAEVVGYPALGALRARFVQT